MRMMWLRATNILLLISLLLMIGRRMMWLRATNILLLIDISLLMSGWIGLWSLLFLQLMMR
jgi:hypothetical protein